MLLACSAVGAVSASAQPPAPAVSTTEMAGSARVHFGTWGVDLSTRDLSVKPGDDFQRYAAGKWMDETDIPADKSSNSIGSEMSDRNQEQLREIVMGAPADSQLGAFFKSYMNEALLEHLDMKPLQADLARVDAIQT
jgi:putative endopeptidase